MRKCLIAAAVLSAFPHVADANSFKVIPSIDLSYETSNIDVESDGQSQEENDLQTLRVLPSLTAIYTAKRLSSTLRVDHEYIDRDSSDKSLIVDSDKDNFTNYRFNSRIAAIENLLSFDVSLNQVYRNPDITNSIINDNRNFLDQLAKTSNDSAGFNLSTPNAEYLVVNMQGRLSQVESDRSFDDPNEIIDTDGSYGLLGLSSGKSFKQLNWSVSSTYYDTESNQETRNYTTRATRGEFSVGLFSDWRLLVRGAVTNNDFGERQSFSRQSGDFESYGAGLSWKPSNDKYLSLTYNESKNNDEEKESYLGVDLSWKFSARTSVRANYGRQFYGESGAFNFNYASRNWQARISYNENITSFSRLIQGQELAGVLVCPDNSTAIEDCFLPDSGDYILQPGETFLDIFTPTFDISDQVQLRKQLSATIGYKLRRLTFSLTALRSDSTTSLEFQDDVNARETITNGIRLNLGLKLGAKSRINWVNNYLENERSSATTFSTYETVSSTLRYTNQLSRYLSVDASVIYADRDSTGSQPSYTERAISVGVKYRFN